MPKHIPEMPLTGDLTTGVYWRPEGKEYLAGSPISTFDQKILNQVNDFEELVWPALAKRIPAFEELKLMRVAGYYDCNKLDNNAVVGKHPKYENVYLASVLQAEDLCKHLELVELDRINYHRLISDNRYKCLRVERVLKKARRTVCIVIQVPQFDIFHQYLLKVPGNLQYHFGFHKVCQVF